MTDPGYDRSAIDELLDRAVRAINRGDRVTADALAGRVLAVDESNVDAEELLAAPADHGELCRITLLFADLVDSTALSTRIEPETYRTVVGRYRDEVARVVDSYDGHIGYTKGDGLLAVFGHPHAHENDVWRAVQSGLDITRDVARLSEQVQRRFGFSILVRVGVHRGLVYLDTAQDDVYGFAVNLAARMCSIAEPGTVAVSEAVERLVRDKFDLQELAPQTVKGIDTPVVSYRPVAERERVLPLGPLVGRPTELSELLARLGEAQHRLLTTAGIGLCGEPGIGKSRLVREAVDLTKKSGGVVVELYGSPFHSDVGLHPVRKLLERRCGITRTSDNAQRIHLLHKELRGRSLDPQVFVPLLAPVLGLTSDAGYTPVAAEGVKLQERITAAIGDYVLSCFDQSHGVVVVEDMHWFDPSTASVVRSLVGTGRPHILPVMTSREPTALPDSSGITLFELGPLSDAHSRELISALDPDVSESDLGTVGSRCGGVPLYIEEVVAKLKTQHSDSSEKTRVPDTLYEALFARLRSSSTAGLVVEAAATIGSIFDAGVLAHVLGMTDDALGEELEQLRRATVVHPLGNGIWRYRHELLREVAAELPPPSARRRLHGKVADALISTSADGDRDWPLIAGHYASAHRFDDAILAYREASTAARHLGALDEAIRHLSRALTQCELLPAGPDRDLLEMHIRLRRGFLASALEGPGSSYTAEDFERCLEIGGTGAFTDELFWTLQAMFTYYVSRADLRRAQQIVDSLTLGLADGREWWRAEVVGGAGTLAFLRGEFGVASELLEQARSLLDARAERDFEGQWFMPYDALVLGATSRAHSRWVMGDLAGADVAFGLSDARCAEVGFPQGPYSLCYAKWIQSWVYLEAGLFDQSAAVAVEMAETAGRHDFDQWAMLGYTMAATAGARAAIAGGNLDAPEIASSTAGLIGWAAASRFVGATGWVTWFDGEGARLLIATGRSAEARQQVDAGIEVGQASEMNFYTAELLRLRAATRDDPDDRHSDLLSAFELAASQGSPVFALRAALDAYQLRGADALPLAERAIQMFPADSTWPELATARARLFPDAVNPGE